MSKDTFLEESSSVTHDIYANKSKVTQNSFQRQIILLLLSVSLFAIIVGARWWTIGEFGTDIPSWDQWDGEGNIFKRYYDGTLTIGDWFASFAEHRIFFTRILSFGLLLVNGQWDARLQMIVNTIIYALVPCGLFLLFSRERSTYFALFLGMALAVIFALPYAWGNTLFAFQSQFYFLIAFTFAAIYTLANSRVGSWSWLIGIIFAGASLLTMGSGLLASLTVLGILFFASIRMWPQWRKFLPRIWLTVAICTIIVIVGYFLAERSDIHAQYRAHSLREYAISLIQFLSWPKAPSLIWALITWPFYILFIAAYLSRKIKDGPRERFILGMGLWVLLQIAAMSYFRAKANVQPRYTDILIFGLIANSLSAIWLINWQTRKGKIIVSLLMVWLVMNSLSLVHVSFWGEITKKKQDYEIERTRTAGFVVTDDIQYLIPAFDPSEIPYPDSKRLAENLRDPAFRHILPVGIQKSLPLIPVGGSPEVSFTEFSRPAYNIDSQNQWDRPGIFSRFAVIQPPNKFKYNGSKTNGLSFLYLFFSGSKNNLSVVDSHGEMHEIILLPSDDGGMWHRAFAYCPTMQFTITGFADTSALMLMEPKEIGPLSICAMVAGQWGRYIFITGIILFIATIPILLIRRNSEKIVQ